MNKKLIMGLAIGLCVIAVGILVTAIIINKTKSNIEDTSTPIISEISEESQTSETNTSNDESNDLNISEPNISNENSETISEPETSEDLGSQYEDYLPALTDEQLEAIGDKDVLYDKYWLTLVHQESQAYHMRHSLGNITSIEIYYLEDARLAYMIFTTTSGKQYIIYNVINISEYAGVYISYNLSIDAITLDRWTERGFNLIHTIDENNHPEILNFFNDVTGEILENNEYKNLYNLTINDL